MNFDLTALIPRASMRLRVLRLIYMSFFCLLLMKGKQIEACTEGSKLEASMEGRKLEASTVGSGSSENFHCSTGSLQ